MLKRKEGFAGERAFVIPQIIINMMEEDALTSSLYITDIGYYPKAEEHYRKRNSPINQYVFIYCMDGKGWFKIGNTKYDVKSNQYFIIPAGIAHEYGADSKNPWTIYWIHFKGNLAKEYAMANDYPRDVFPQSDSRISYRIDLFEEIFSTLKSGYTIDNLRYTSSLFHYYLGSLRFIQQYRKAGSVENTETDIIKKSIHYMKENIEKKLTLGEIASYTGYSVSHYSTLFREKTGHSPLAYFNLLKIEKATMLLDTTDMKINQICYKVGMEDTYYFSRIFTRLMGISPNQYRKTNKG